MKDPEICISGAFRIDRDGVWYHEGSAITRREMVKLFASVLMREADGSYWLKTPVEKVRVDVEDAPFVAVDLAVDGQGPNQRVRLQTNLGEWLDVGPDHPLLVRKTATGPRPYVVLSDGLEARISRAVYYELVELAMIGSDADAGIWSQGRFFPLDPDGGPGS